MKASRRNFLAAGLALPAAGLASVPSTSSRPEPPALAPDGGLTYRTLGRTGLKVTSVAFGCMITSDASVVEKAADVGINHFDTARGYQSGNNEKMVGAALKAKRKQIILSTKTKAETKEEALAHIDTSLQTLGTDYVDIWYLHGKSSGEQLKPELMEAQEIAKKAGKIRFAGFSTHSGHAAVIPAGIKTGHFDVILSSYNFAIGPELDPLFAEAKKANIGIVAMKVMAGGFRSNRPGTKIADTLKKEGAFLSALKWVLKNPNVSTTIPSITDLDQLDENLKAMSGAFTADDEKVLAAQLERITPLYCRGCSSCGGTCAKGVPVQDMIRFAMYSDGYGQFALGRERYLELPEEVRSIRCTDCTECSVRCRNGVHVAERVMRAQELFA